MQRAGGAGIADAAVVQKDPDGKTHVKGTLDGGAVGGAAIGGALGLLLFMFFPILGVAIGAIGGALVGHAVSDRIDKDFVREVTEKLEAGHSALFVLIKDAEPDAVLAALRPIEGGTIDPDHPRPRGRGRGAQGRRIAASRRGRDQSGGPDADRDRVADRGCRRGGVRRIASSATMAVTQRGRPGSTRSGSTTTCCSAYDGETTGIHECWTILAAIAEATSRVQLGTLVHVHGVPQPGAAGQDGRRRSTTSATAG